MAINPAMFVDDVFDAYIMAKRQGLGPKKDKDNQVQTVKSAGVEEAKAKAIKELKGIGSYLTSPTTGALSLSGAYSSAYGPEWAGGPTQQDVDEGKRFDPKRMAKAVGMWNTLGRAIASVPHNAIQAVTADKTRTRAISTLATAPGLVGAGFIAHDIHNDQDPDLHKARRYAAPLMLASGLANNHEAIASYYDAQEAALHAQYAGGN